MKQTASLDLGLSGKCYAFSKGEVIDNFIPEDSYSLKFDHPFTYKNVTIDANQNLFEIDEIKNKLRNKAQNELIDKRIEELKIEQKYLIRWQPSPLRPFLRQTERKVIFLWESNS